MSHSAITPQERFATIVEEFAGHPEVTPPSGKGFGASGLRVRGRIFAMLSSGGEFVARLPRQRVDALIASGEGKRFDPGHGRLMKEWVAVAPTSAEEWLPLAREAMAFANARG